MRKQIDGLANLAKDVIQHDPMSGVLFAFINARRTPNVSRTFDASLTRRVKHKSIRTPLEATHALRWTLSASCT